MTAPLKVLAIDPGEKVGWARATVHPSGRWTQTKHGIAHLKDMAMTLDTQLGNYDVCIYETFRLRASAAKYLIGNDMQTSQFIGMVRFIAWKHPQVQLVAQGPDAKAMALRSAPPHLKKRLAGLPKAHDASHDGDALLHLWAWTFRTIVAPDA